MRLKLHGELAEQSIIVVRGAQTSSSPSNYLFCLSPRYCHVIFLIERIEFLYRGLVKNVSLRFVRCCRILVTPPWIMMPDHESIRILVKTSYECIV